ncbi:MAG: ArsR/SmtB family transcription factor [Paracoccaceae bacterium]
MAHKLNQIFSALADPTRRDILILLLEDDMAVTDIAEPFDMSLAAISKHLIVLRNAGLILQERRGRVKWCKLNTEAMHAAFIWIQSFGQLEPINLDSFEEFLTREKLLNASDIS